MADQTPPPLPRPPSPLWAPALVIAGLAYLGLGVLLAVVFAFGGVQSSLFPTGWLFPAVLVVTGGLMASRQRFDMVATLWVGLTAVVFMLGVLVYVNALDRGLDDAAAFDATLIVAGLGLLALLLRPGFRS
jgi:hypothetical protein